MEGLFCIITALVLVIMTNAFRRLPNQKSIKGTVVATENKKTVHSTRKRYIGYVEYVVDDKVYSIASNYISSNMRVGQSIRISYDESNPENAITRPPMFIYLLFVGLIIMGLYMIIQSGLTL